MRSAWKQAANDAIEVVVAFVHQLNTVPEMGQLLSDLVHNEETMASLTGAATTQMRRAQQAGVCLRSQARTRSPVVSRRDATCVRGGARAEEQRRVAEMHHEEFKAGGTTLPKDGRERVVKLQMEVDRLRWEFAQNAHNCPVTEFAVPEFDVEDLPAGFR